MILDGIQSMMANGPTGGSLDDLKAKLKDEAVGHSDQGRHHNPIWIIFIYLGYQRMIQLYMYFT